MSARHATSDVAPQPVRGVPLPAVAAAPDFRWVDRQIHLGGVVRTKAQAQEAIDFIKAVMTFMPEAEAPVAEPPKTEEPN